MVDTVKVAAALRQGDDPYGFKLKGERPEKILVINCGSSSLKYTFSDMPNDSRNASRLVERIGIESRRVLRHGPRPCRLRGRRPGRRCGGNVLGLFRNAQEATQTERRHRPLPASAEAALSFLPTVGGMNECLYHSYIPLVPRTKEAAITKRVLILDSARGVFRHCGDGPGKEHTE